MGYSLYSKIDDYLTGGAGASSVFRFASFTDEENNNINRLAKTLKNRGFLIAVNDAHKRLSNEERKDLSYTGSFGNEKSPQGRYDSTKSNYYYRVLRPLLCYEGYVWNVDHQEFMKTPWPLLSGVSSVYHDTDMKLKKSRRVSLSHLKDKYRSVDLWKLKDHERKTIEYLNIVDSISYTQYYRYKKIALLHIDPNEKNHLKNSYRIICATFPSSVLDISDMEILAELINYYKKIDVTMTLVSKSNHRKKKTITTTLEEYNKSPLIDQYTNKSRFILHQFCRVYIKSVKCYHRVRFLLFIAEKFKQLIIEDLSTVGLLLYEIYLIDMSVEDICIALNEIKKTASK